MSDAAARAVGELRALLARHADLEKRAMSLYRRLAQRFPGTAAGRLWLELSNAEAGHFAVLQLTADWAAVADPPAFPAPPGGGFEDETGRLTAIEAEAERGELTAAEGAALTVEWEELELPRIVRVVGGLPEPARARARAALLGEAEAHFRMLGALVEAADAGHLAPRAAALAGEARAAVQA